MWNMIKTLIIVLLTSTASADAQDPVQLDIESFQQPHWSQQEVENVALIGDFVQRLMNDHDFDAVLQRYNNSRYVQHNRNIPDGIEGLVGFLQLFVQQYPDYSYEVQHVYADGTFVIFHSHATLRKQDRGNDRMGLNIIDTWRIEDGQIVEHWDAIQALDDALRQSALETGAIIRNDNGVF
ncbi:MAG: nuclear transport factor 2 family protein [Pseudomonadota bacterium]